MVAGAGKDASPNRFETRKATGMGNRYTYDCVIIREDDGWVVNFPQIPEAYTDGDTREEAMRNAVEVLTLSVGSRELDGKAMPEYKRSAEVVSVTVEITDEIKDELGYMTVAMAADDLNVTPSRVHALIRSGKLDAKWFDGVRKVSIDSVNAYRMTPRKAGRPAVMA